MSQLRPLITVCIPAYNRARFLPLLLDSILPQCNQDIEILVCEDGSPERAQISRIVEYYKKQSNVPILYQENESNLGYDGNIRRLVEAARGNYCLFMGNDDLLAPNSIDILTKILRQNPKIGVVVRSYASFDENSAGIKQIFRYFPEEKLFEAGPKAVSVAYRRSVVIPGMVIHRDSAFQLATDEYDGTLLYQLYLVGRIAAQRHVLFTPEIIALRRDGVAPDFGHSQAEKDIYTPTQQTANSSVAFMTGMLRIARELEDSTGLLVYNSICSDISAYSYPIISIQANNSRRKLFSYGMTLRKIGLGKSLWFHVYFISLLIFGKKNCDLLIRIVKRLLGSAPRIGAAKGL